MLYSFVVPTRERPDVLKGTIGSILNQTRSNFEVVVMDNASSPATKDVVDSFQSPHIRYFRSDERLAMTDNWELALQHATGDYVTVLGDDDGALPDAVEIAEEIHKVWPGALLTWRPLIYFWPNTFIEAYRNLVHMHLGSRVEERSARALLKDVYACKKLYDELPSLYDSFVPRNLIERIRAKYGRYFLSLSPDIASGLINALIAETYIYSYRPLAIRGISYHSTGTSQSFPHVENSPAKLFSKEVKGGTWDKALHEKLAGDFIIEVSITSEFLCFKEKYFPDDQEIQPDMRRFIKWFCKSAPRFMARYDEVKEAIYTMAKKNGVPSWSIRIPPRWPSIEQVKRNQTYDKNTNTLYWSFYANENQIKNIADFAQLASSISASKENLEIVHLPQKLSVAVRLMKACGLR